MREDYRVLARFALEHVAALAAKRTSAKQEKVARVLGKSKRRQALFDR
jgi:hypothetical protein